MKPRIAFDRQRLAALRANWKITEFLFFGSVLRDDFGPQSDVDVLVNFAPEAHPTLLDLSRLADELSALFGRRVDLLTRRGVESSRNALRRQAILSSAERVDAA